MILSNQHEFKLNSMDDFNESVIYVFVKETISIIHFHTKTG